MSWAHRVLLVPFLLLLLSVPFILGGSQYSAEDYDGQGGGDLDTTNSEDDYSDIRWDLNDDTIVRGSDDINSVRFLLYSVPHDAQVYEVLELGNVDSVRSSKLDLSHPIKILIHGFRSAYNSTFPQNVKNAYLETKSDFPYNVIVVDWGALAIRRASYRQYPRAVRNVRRVAERVYEFISWLRVQHFVDPNNIHMVGHSLGAHVSGDAGNLLKENFQLEVGRITGLDPAGPEFFPRFNGARKLSSSDAQYVDVIHTNAGKLGILENVGQANFWMNGGSGPQPGCSNFTTKAEAQHSLQQLVSGGCSHRMATVFFANSIRKQEDFEVCACSSKLKYMIEHGCCDRRVIFGEFSRPGTRGTFYLRYKIITATTSDHTSKVKKLWSDVKHWFSHG